MTRMLAEACELWSPTFTTTTTVVRTQVQAPGKNGRTAEEKTN